MENCPLLTIFLLLKQLGLIKDHWWEEESRNPVLLVSPRLISVILFNFAGLANLYLHDPEGLKDFLDLKGINYAFSFIRRKFISDNRYLELDTVLYIYY